jgi:hypothetical protein
MHFGANNKKTWGHTYNIYVLLLEKEIYATTTFISKCDRFLSRFVLSYRLY